MALDVETREHRHADSWMRNAGPYLHPGGAHSIPITTAE